MTSDFQPLTPNDPRLRPPQRRKEALIEARADAVARRANLRADVTALLGLVLTGVLADVPELLAATAALSWRTGVLADFDLRQLDDAGCFLAAGGMALPHAPEPCVECGQPAGFGHEKDRWCEAHAPADRRGLGSRLICEGLGWAKGEHLDAVLARGAEKVRRRAAAQLAPMALATPGGGKHIVAHEPTITVDPPVVSCTCGWHVTLAGGGEHVVRTTWRNHLAFVFGEAPARPTARASQGFVPAGTTVRSGDPVLIGKILGAGSVSHDEARGALGAEPLAAGTVGAQLDAADRQLRRATQVPREHLGVDAARPGADQGVQRVEVPWPGGPAILAIYGAPRVSKDVFDRIAAWAKLPPDPARILVVELPAGARLEVLPRAPLVAASTSPGSISATVVRAALGGREVPIFGSFTAKLIEATDEGVGDDALVRAVFQVLRDGAATPHKLGVQLGADQPDLEGATDQERAVWLGSFVQNVAKRDLRMLTDAVVAGQRGPVRTQVEVTLREAVAGSLGNVVPPYDGGRPLI